MIIGNFKYDNDRDTYTGEIHTLTLSRSNVMLRPTETKNGKGPHYRVVADLPSGEFELGAAWKRADKAGKLYLSVMLDDPTLPRPVSAAMIHEGVTGALLIWSRPSKRKVQSE
jgi:uncharacterized protein (DUF736 family)